MPIDHTIVKLKCVMFMTQRLWPSGLLWVNILPSLNVSVY